jgi:hypothetical protein
MRPRGSRRSIRISSRQMATSSTSRPSNWLRRKPYHSIASAPAAKGSSPQTTGVPANASSGRANPATAIRIAMRRPKGPSDRFGHSRAA